MFQRFKSAPFDHCRGLQGRQIVRSSRLAPLPKALLVNGLVQPVHPTETGQFVPSWDGRSTFQQRSQELELAASLEQALRERSLDAFLAAAKSAEEINTRVSNFVMNLYYRPMPVADKDTPGVLTASNVRGEPLQDFLRTSKVRLSLW